MPYGGGGYGGGGGGGYGGGRGGGGRRGDRDRDDYKEVDPNDERFRKLFIGGLSFDTDEKGLREHFEEWGEIVDCVVMRDPQSKRSRGFGFITYKDAESIDQAQANRPHTLDSREVETKRAMPREESGSQQSVKKMFIGGCKDDTTEDMVRDLFGELGDIEKIEMITDKATGKMRGFCFVTFTDSDYVDKCVLKKRFKLNGRSVEVKKALPQDQMGGGGGGGGSGGGRGGRGGGGSSGGGRPGGRGDYGGGYNNDGGGYGGGYSQQSYGGGSSYGGGGGYGSSGYASGGGYGSGGGGGYSDYSSGYGASTGGGGWNSGGFGSDYDNSYGGGAMRGSGGYTSRGQGPYGSGYGSSSGGAGGGGGGYGGGGYGRR